MSANYLSKISKTKHASKVWLVLYPLWILTTFIVSAVIVALLLRLLIVVGVPLEKLSQTVLLTMADTLAYVVSLGLTIGLPWWIRKHKISLEQLGLARLPVWSDLILGPVGIIPYFLISGVLLVLASAIMPGFNAAQVQDVGFSNLTGQSSYLLAFLTLVVVAPLAEEILFRGYLYGKLRMRSSAIIAAVLTSLTFAIVHGQPNVAVDVFGLSLVLCALREVTGSIWAGVLLHTTKNALAFYLLFISPLMVH